MYEKLNSYRVFPRLVLLAYGVLVWKVSEWVMSLDVVSMEQGGFAAVIIGMSGAIFNFYLNSGSTK